MKELIKKIFKDRIVYHNEEGKIHRDNDLPVVEWNDSGIEWWLNGIKYSEDQYNQELIKLKLKRLVEL